MWIWPANELTARFRIVGERRLEDELEREPMTSEVVTNSVGYGLRYACAAILRLVDCTAACSTAVAQAWCRGAPSAAGISMKHRWSNPLDLQLCNTTSRSLCPHLCYILWCFLSFATAVWNLVRKTAPGGITIGEVCGASCARRKVLVDRAHGRVLALRLMKTLWTPGTHTHTWTAVKHQ